MICCLIEKDRIKMKNTKTKKKNHTENNRNHQLFAFQFKPIIYNTDMFIYLLIFIYLFTTYSLYIYI